MKFLAIAAFMTVLICSCHEPDQQQATNENTTPKTDTTKAYIPVNDYLRGEMRTIDSLPVGILKRLTIGNKTDSGFIQPAEFRQLSAQFLTPELEKGKFEQTFTESSFFDQSTELLTFTYASTDPASTVRRVDVLISPSLALDKVKSIYIEKAWKSNDTAINSKLYWKSGTSFQVVTEKLAAQQLLPLEQLKVIWDPRSY
jgi:hypothetical protein